jgi:DNA-binding response OmpR family regulator
MIKWSIVHNLIQGGLMFHILVVDDDKNTRLLFKTILEKANYTVFTAENGSAALEVMDREHIDLAVVDIMMPRMNGYEFTGSLRAVNNVLPILMVSARQLPKDKYLGFDAGIDDYMTKPVEREEFLYRIKALLRRAKIVNERKIIIGEVVIDYDSMTVRRGEQVISLPQKEFLLLYKLLSYPDKIFTRIQIMDEIWGVDSEAGWETVTVHIARLRKHFEGWDEFSIESIRGIGYKAVKRV